MSGAALVATDIDPCVQLGKIVGLAEERQLPATVAVARLLEALGVDGESPLLHTIAPLAGGHDQGAAVRVQGVAVAAAGRERQAWLRRLNDRNSPPLVGRSGGGGGGSPR
jgi:hypothetical protein